jgi:hypothetical protein
MIGSRRLIFRSLSTASTMLPVGSVMHLAGCWMGVLGCNGSSAKLYSLSSCKLYLQPKSVAIFFRSKASTAGEFTGSNLGVNTNAQCQPCYRVLQSWPYRVDYASILPAQAAGTAGSHCAHSVPVIYCSVSLYFKLICPVRLQGCILACHSILVLLLPVYQL